MRRAHPAFARGFVELVGHQPVGPGNHRADPRQRGAHQLHGGAERAAGHFERAYITANIGEPDLNVEDLSRHFGISRTQFYRKLDALIAKPIGDFIRSIRLEMAAQLLKERRLSIAEVAYTTGFSSPSHFSRTFKKAYGKAPSEGQ